MLTQPGCLLALVDVLADAGPGSVGGVLETGLAQAPIRSGRVLATAVRTANAAEVLSRVDAALVDVQAVLIGADRETRRALANVAALTILASLTGSTLVTAVRALVDVDAVRAARWIQLVSVSAEYPRDASAHGYESDQLNSNTLSIDKAKGSIIIIAGQIHCVLEVGIEISSTNSVLGSCNVRTEICPQIT